MDLRNPVFWKFIYDVIRSEFGFNYEKDVVASILATTFRPRNPLSTINIINELIRGKSVLIVGASNECVSSCKYFKEYDTVIAADGAMLCCINECGFIPDIVVSDLDGISANIIRRFPKVIYVIHFHGDNVEICVNSMRVIKEVNAKYVPTVQVYPNGFGTFIFGGFTDGDRAAYLGYYFHAKKLGLVGFNLFGPIGKYSKITSQASKYPYNVLIKRRKLMWTYRLLKLLKSLGRGEVSIEFLR